MWARLRSLKSARRIYIVSPCCSGFVSRPSKVLVHVERLSTVSLSFFLCMRPNQKTAKEWERRKFKRAYDLEHKSEAVVRLMAHSFALGIFEDGKQRNVILSDGSYWLSTKSSSYLVSAMSNHYKFE